MGKKLCFIAPRILFYCNGVDDYFFIFLKLAIVKCMLVSD